MKQNNQVLIIGLTGGVGSGKTLVSQILSQHCHVYHINTDRMAEEQMKRGGCTFLPVVKQFGEAFLNTEGEIDRKRLGEYIFHHLEELIKLNAITHPAVNREVEKRIRNIRQGRIEPGCRVILIESAILVEAGYKEICDEIWYVYATRKIRQERLRKERGYPEERIRSMMKRQGTERFFRENADVVIDSNQSPEDVSIQVQRLLKRRGLLST